MNIPLLKAIAVAGGQRRLAEKLGVSSMAVSQWKRRGIPPHRVIEIERAIDGEITRYELRPDIFGTKGDAA